MAANSRADAVAVLASSGGGKSHYVHGRIAADRPARLLIWSPLEKSDNYGRYGVVIRHDVSKLVDHLTARRSQPFAVVFVPAMEDQDRLYKHFNVVCGLALALSDIKPVLLIAEELKYVTKPGWAPHRWVLVSTEGRHHGLSTIGTTQRPALVDKTFLAGANEVRCGQLGSASDKKAMADAMDVPLLDIRALRKGEFLVKDTYTGQVSRQGKAIALEPVRARSPRKKPGKNPAP